jgi:hypothetical protein
MEACKSLQGLGSHTKDEKRKTFFLKNNIHVANR